jgi:hypothetical protein
MSTPSSGSSSAAGTAPRSSSSISGRRGSVESVLRTNVLHRAFVLGASRPQPAREARVYVRGRMRAHEVVDFDVDERVELVRCRLAELGEHLERDCVITGSVVQVPVAPGDEVAVELDGLGHLEVTIAP